MHVVFLTNEYPTFNVSHGGIGTFIKYLAKNLVENNIDVSIIGFGKERVDREYSDGFVKVYQLKQSSWKLARFLDKAKILQKKIKEINKNKKIDIVEGSELSFAFFPKKTTYKKLIRLHGGHHFFASEEDRKINYWKSYQEKKSFFIADSFVAVSNYVGDRTQKLLNYTFAFKTIYNSVDFNKFYESNIKNEEPFKLLFIGTVCEKKGVESLILAMPKLIKEFSEVSLEIVGRDWVDANGSYTSYLKTLIDKSIADKIEFSGSISYDLLPKVIEKAHICIYPSLAESFGLTLIEGMLMGKQVLASNIEPFIEITRNAIDVKLFKANSPEDIFQKVSMLLKNDRIEARKRNRVFILNKFSVQRIIKENIDFYKSLSIK